MLVLSDNCKKLGLVFENVVGIVEIINSKAIQLQVRNTYRMFIFGFKLTVFAVKCVINFTLAVTFSCCPVLNHDLS